MLDWYVLLTPLLLLPIIALFVFVGCALEHPAIIGVRANVRLQVSVAPDLVAANITVTTVQFVVRLTGATQADTTIDLTASASNPMNPPSFSGDNPLRLGEGWPAPITVPALVRQDITRASSARWSVTCNATLRSGGTLTLSQSYDVSSGPVAATQNFLFRLNRNPVTNVLELIRSGGI